MLTTNIAAEFPNAWELEAAYDADVEDEEEHSNFEGGGGKKDDHVVTPRGQSEGYRSFLTFLETGCSGSPVRNYPIVVVVLSTIPPSVCSKPFGFKPSISLT